MRRASLRRARHDQALSAMMDVFLVVMVVTVAIVGTWVFSFSGESRRSVQLDEYNLHFATLSMQRWLGSTLPDATLVDSAGKPMSLKDQKVLELLGIELVLLRQGASPGKFDEMDLAIKALLDKLMLPDHRYAANAVDTTGPGAKAGKKGPVGVFFFVSSEPAEDLSSYEESLDGHPTYTSAYAYSVPEGLGGLGAGGPLQMTVNLACWVE